MCVTTLNSCTYAAGNDASVIIEFTIEPEPGFRCGFDWA